MPVLCGVIQNKATSQNYNGLITTRLELLRETLIMSSSEVLIYYMNSTGFSQREMRLFYINNDIRSYQWRYTPIFNWFDSKGYNEAYNRNTRSANSYDAHVPSHNSEILKRSLYTMAVSYGIAFVMKWNLQIMWMFLSTCIKIWFYSHPSYAVKRLDNLSYMIWVLILYSEERISKILCISLCRVLLYPDL